MDKSSTSASISDFSVQSLIKNRIVESNPPAITIQVAAPAEPVNDLPDANGYEWNSADSANSPPITYRKEELTVSATPARLPSPTMTFNPVK